MGEPNAEGTNILNGSATITWRGSKGQTLSVQSVVVSNRIYGVTLSQETMLCDEFGRATNITYLDGTQIKRGYDCCGLEWETDREGVTPNYEYDSLQRLWLTTRNGITVSNVYDAA